jgi:hypothetical protein
LQLASFALRGGRADYQAILDLILNDNRCTYKSPQIITDATEGVETFEQAMIMRGYDVNVVESKRIGVQVKNLTDGYVHQALYEAGDSDADIVALVSGDSDFDPALNYIKLIKGKIVEVYALRDTLSIELYAVADRIAYLDDLSEKGKNEKSYAI